MKVVVFGASGNIGTALLRRLDGHDVVAVARRPVSGSAREGITWVSADAASSADLVAITRGADVVVNLAWLMQPSRDPELTWANNIGIAYRLLSAARLNDVPTAVFASSIAAYAPRVDTRPVTESWPTSGDSNAAYAREKAYVERLLDIFEAERPEATVIRIRPAFVFQRSAATEQRRLFAGPLLPGTLLRPGLVPAMPVPRDIALQTVHADDVADATARAIDAGVPGAFNLAADGVLDGAALARLLDARPVPVPARYVRGAMSLAWHARLMPAPPDLFNALMRLPVMSTDRAREELAWRPRHTAQEAVQALLTGMRRGDDGDTPPLDSQTSGPLRSHEFTTGVGSRQG